MTDPAAPRIAVLEDDSDYLLMMQDVLHNEGYQPLLWTDPLAAITSVTVEQPNLVLLSVWFGGQPLGTTVLRAIKESPQTSHIPVILGSGDEKFLNDIALNIQALCAAIVIKPFAIDELLDEISRALAAAG